MDNSAADREKDEAGWTGQFTLDGECSARGSDLCWKFANQGGCEHCYVHGLREKEQQKGASELWEKTVRLLPADIDELSESETCWFCTGEDKEKADGYAVLDMANPEPYASKGIFFGYGKKVRTPVGSLVSLHISIGPKCRKAFRMVEVIQVGWLIGMIVLALVLLMIPAISGPMVRTFMLLPVVFLALMGGAGYAVGRSLSLSYMNKQARGVCFDVAKIPMIRKMLGRDWYFFQSDRGIPHMSFTKKRGCAAILPPRKKEKPVDTADGGMVD